jgi:hypothetical protein
MAAVETPGSDDDLYEDAGDLEFYDKNATNNTFEKLWLARVPKYVWESWMKLTDRLGPDDEVQIGTLRTWNETNPDGSDRVRETLRGHDLGRREPTKGEGKCHFVQIEADMGDIYLGQTKDAPSEWLARASDTAKGVRLGGYGPCSQEPLCVQREGLGELQGSQQSASRCPKRRHPDSSPTSQGWKRRPRRETAVQQEESLSAILSQSYSQYE